MSNGQSLLTIRFCNLEIVFAIFDFNLSKLSTTLLDMFVLVSLVPTWIIKQSGCFLTIGIMYWLITSTLTPEKWKTLTLRCFLDYSFLWVPFTIESPTIRQVLNGQRDRLFFSYSWFLSTFLSWRLSHCFEISLFLLFSKDRDLRPALWRYSLCFWLWKPSLCFSSLIVVKILFVLLLSNRCEDIPCASPL